jgi:hypothetical protein
LTHLRNQGHLCQPIATALTLGAPDRPGPCPPTIVPIPPTTGRGHSCYTRQPAAHAREN